MDDSAGQPEWEAVNDDMRQAILVLVIIAVAGVVVFKLTRKAKEPRPAPASAAAPAAEGNPIPNATGTGRDRASDHADPIIIDILQKAMGMVDVPGESLYFRLYKSGRVEYERPAKYRSGSRLEWRMARREITLSPEESKKLIDLFDQPDMLKAKEYYALIFRPIDSSTTTTINYKGEEHSRQIVIAEYYAYDNPRARAIYPPSLIRLMKEIETIRSMKAK